jgi:uncharacterized membrane protein YbhN (UPF0104 family)
MNYLKNKWVKRLLAIAIVAAVGYFFYAALSDNWEAVRKIEIRFNYLSVLAIVFFTVSVLVTGYLWGAILNELTRGQKRVSAWTAMRVQIASWLLKYIPGHVGSVANKIAWAAKSSYSKKLVLISFIYENVFYMVASFAFSIPVLVIGAGTDTFTSNATYLILPLLVLVPMVIVANRKLMHKVMNFAFTKILKQPVGEEFFLRNWQTAKLQALFLIPRLLIGAGFVLVALSFLEIPVEAYVPLAAAYILAGAVGILAVFVPSGLGVREAVIVIFASQYMPVEQAIIVSIIARLYATIADGVLAVLYGTMTLRNKKG